MRQGTSLTGRSDRRYYEAVQRLRLRFSRGEELKYISHLDVMRLWERVLRRADIPMAYSEGFSPHPRISLAAPLPIGVTSEAELMDVVISKAVSPYFLIQNTKPQLPKGMEVFEVLQVSLTAPSLQSQAQFIDYRVSDRSNRSAEEIKSAITAMLRADKLPWHHERDTGPRFYDLRPLIEDLWLESWKDQFFTLGMRLRCDARGTGRPEQVTAALALTDHPGMVHRTKITLAGS
jgi:radical SAM-linked protein